MRLQIKDLKKKIKKKKYSDLTDLQFHQLRICRGRRLTFCVLEGSFRFLIKTK